MSYYPSQGSHHSHGQPVVYASSHHSHGGYNGGYNNMPQPYVGTSANYYGQPGYGGGYNGTGYNGAGGVGGANVLYVPTQSSSHGHRHHQSHHSVPQVISTVDGGQIIVVCVLFRLQELLMIDMFMIAK